MSEQLDMREAIAVVALHVVAVELLAECMAKASGADAQQLKGTALRLAAQAVRNMPPEKLDAICRSHLEARDHA